MIAEQVMYVLTLGQAAGAKSIVSNVTSSATGVANGNIQFAQKGISSTFSHGEFAGQKIKEVAAGLRSGAINPSQLPIQTITRNEVTYTLNNRSLMALRVADMAPTVIKDVTGNTFFENQLTQRLLEIGSPSSPSFVPKIRGGL